MRKGREFQVFASAKKETPVILPQLWGLETLKSGCILNKEVKYTYSVGNPSIPMNSRYDL